MVKIVLCSKTDRPNEYAFVYKEIEDYILRTEVGGLLLRDKHFGKHHDNIVLSVDSDIVPIVIELMYDCLEEEKSFKVII